ncbi:MAG: hypothetical protein R3F13_13215 [Prosthecobacter sp.]
MAAADDIRTYLMPYAGVTTAARLPAGTSARMLTDLNAVLQQLFGGGQQERKTLLVRAPTTITIDNVTSESTAITFTGYAASMLGCTALITGDARENRLVKSSGTLALENAYLGPTGTNVSATLHYDCVTADSSIAKIYEPMSLDRKWALTLVDRSVIDQCRWGMDRRQIMRPLRAAIEKSLDASAGPGRRIVFDTLPDQAYILHFMADVRPPAVTSFDDTRTNLLPDDLDDSILKPLVLAAFSTHPDFTGDFNQVQSKAQIAWAQWEMLKGEGLARRSVSLMD